MVLARLSTAGMRVNISKSKFIAEQVEYLGYWIARQSIQPLHNKVEAILNIKAPKTRKEDRTTLAYWYMLKWSKGIKKRKKEGDKKRKGFPVKLSVKVVVTKFITN
jgi:hypothetical protein